MANINRSTALLIAVSVVVIVLVSAVSPVERLPQRRRVPSAYKGKVPRWMALRNRRALQRRCPSMNYYDYVLPKKGARRSGQRARARQLLRQLRMPLFARCRQLARTATVARCRRHGSRRRRMQCLARRPTTRRSEDTKEARAACKDLDGTKRLYNCIRDHFKKDEFQVSGYVQQYALPTAACHGIAVAPGRCFKLLKLRTNDTSGPITKVVDSDGRSLGPYRWKGDMPNALDETWGWNPQWACVNMNYGRAATVNNEAILKLVYDMVLKHSRKPSDEGYNVCGTFVDGYAVDYKKFKGSKKKNDWKFKYAPMIQGQSTRVTIPHELWGIDAKGVHEPNGADQDYPAMCVSINYRSGKFDDVRCGIWQYAICEYSLEMPQHCVPLVNEPGRCFKIKSLEVTNYGAMWAANRGTKGKYSGNEFQARECHDRTPGRLASIDTKEALELAKKLMSLKTTNKGECVMVDGQPSYYEESASDSVIDAELERRWKGSTTKSHWKAGGGKQIPSEYWASDQPDNQHGDQACACLHPRTKLLHNAKCDAEWHRIICEYDTPMRGLPAQNEQVGKICGSDFAQHLFKTCEAMKSNLYRFSCPCKVRLEDHFKKRGDWADGCCKQGCPQKYFVYHCCLDELWFNRVSSMGDMEEQIFDEVRELD